MPTLLQCSVIIPVYNLAKYISPMLKSLKEQKLGDYNIEIIFVINNCTDRTEEVIMESGLECRILYCHEQGCGPARNRGFEEAHGEYIWFMDGDDWLLSNTAIKDVLDKAYNDNLDILRIPFASERYKQNYFSMVWQYLFKKDFIEEIKFPSVQPAEDDAFMIKVLAKKGMSWAEHLSLPHIDETLYYYNFMRPGSNMMRYYAGEKI